MGKTLVLGASTNPARYSYLAINRLKCAGEDVVAIGNKPGEVSGITINTGLLHIDGLDTVTLYLSPENQKGYYGYIIGLKPKRVIFNPGTENQEFIEQLKQNGISAEIACTLVLLATGQY